MTDPNQMADDLEELLTGLVVKVVLLRHEGSQIVPMLGTMPANFAADRLDASLVAELVDSATTLDAPAAVPVDIVRALLLEPVPTAFTRTPLLHEHRTLTFTDAGVPAGGHILRYHREFGVYVGEDA